LEQNWMVAVPAIIAVSALLHAGIARMESDPGEIAVLQWLAAAGAIGAAFSLGYIAHNDFGISFQEIRIVAAIGASTIAALLSIEYFGRKLVSLNDQS
jgi:hypothetical protein